MGKITRIELSAAEVLKLDNGFKNGSSHCYRMRCKAVLLKSEGLSSKEIGQRLDMTLTTVNGWIHRYQAEGIQGLETRSGRGRKQIIDSSDEETIRKAIEEDRQSVAKAKEAWEQASGKEASEITFKRFLSALAQDIND